MRFVAIVFALVLFAVPGEAQPPGKVYRIGVLGPGAPSPLTEEFRRRLSELGYVDGQNIRLESRWAGGNAERLPTLATELVQARVDVIVAFISSAAKAAQQATTAIPIVMVAVGDPVGLGLVASLARPGANITGTTSFGPELDAKRIELLKEAIPGMQRLAILWNPTNPLHEASLRYTEMAARRVGVETHPLKVSSVDEIEGAFQSATQGRVGAMVVYADGAVLTRNGARIAALALGSRLPTVFLNQADVEAGGLMAYGANLSQVFRRGADYVDMILQGRRPAELPVEEPTKFDLAINLKTAKALGLTLSPSLLLRADRVIE